MSASRTPHSFAQWGLRAVFAAADVVAPRLGSRLAHRLWFTAPPRPPRDPLPDGGQPFTIAWQGRTIRGTVWGCGPVVYLVHGWGGRGSQLAGFVEPLVALGHSVVMFDAPGHGDSDDGPSGRRTHAVEFGQVLDEVFTRFGPAETVIAHSLGALGTMLALRHGWLSTNRLVLLAPLVGVPEALNRLQHLLGFGERTRGHLDRRVAEFVGLPAADLDVKALARQLGSIPTMVVHDRNDRQLPYAEAVELVMSLPDVRLVSTEGLGHRRILRDSWVINEVLTFAQRRVSPVATRTRHSPPVSRQPSGVR